MTLSLHSAVTHDLRQLLLPVALTQCQGRTIISFSGRSSISLEAESGEQPPVEYLDEEGLSALTAAGHWARGFNGAHDDFAIRFAAMERSWIRRAGSRAVVRGALAGWQLQKALRILGENLDLSVELDDIAVSCRISRAHFAKAFRRSVGIPPYRWRLELRLAMARRALIETVEPLPQIAQRFGFQQMTHFSHAFMRTTGMSPRQWRQTFQSMHWVDTLPKHPKLLQTLQMDFGEDLFVHLELLHSPDDPVVAALSTLLVTAFRKGGCLDGSAQVLVDAMHLCSKQARLTGKPCKASHGELADWQLALARQMLSTPTEEGSIAAVAAACGTSPGYFSKAFRATLGMCPRRWQAHARVDQAKTLLESSSRLMIDIAGECGFSEQSHFNHTFTRLVGCNPGTWRNLHQQVDAGFTTDGVAAQI